MGFPHISRYSSVVLKQSSASESSAAPLSVILFRARLRERRTTLASSASATSLAPPSSMLQPLRSSSVRVALTARALQSFPMFFGLHTRLSDGNRHERKARAPRGDSQMREIVMREFNWPSLGRISSSHLHIRLSFNASFVILPSTSASSSAKFSVISAICLCTGGGVTF
jgi:hypothetical protein